MEAQDAEVRAQYLDYLKQYRACLAQTDIAQLEDDWRILDEKWMKIRCRSITQDALQVLGDPYPVEPASHALTVGFWVSVAKDSISEVGSPERGEKRVGPDLARRYWIQVVHDIEYGYGDPLRTKVICPVCTLSHSSVKVSLSLMLSLRFTALPSMHSLVYCNCSP